MRRLYSLQPSKIDGEREAVTRIVGEKVNTPATLESLLSISGTRRLRPVAGIDSEGAKIVVRAGAAFNRFEGVALSNGFNVLEVDQWRGQGIGTIALNVMIEWAKHHHPSTELRPTELRRSGRIIQQTDPRRGFYARFGVEWNEADRLDAAPDWLAAPLTVAALRLAPMPPVIEPLP